MKTLKLYMIGLVAIMISTFSQSSFAQPYGSGYQSFINTLITNKIWENVTANSKKKKPENSGVSKSSSRTSTTQVPLYRVYPAVRFKSTGTRLTLQEMVDAPGVPPQAKAKLKELLARILDEYEAAAAAKGLQNDLALAIVSYIELNSNVYHQRTEEQIIPFGQNVGVRDSLGEHANRNGIFNNLTDRQKQEMYEGLVMMSGLIFHFYEEAKRKNNAEELKTIKIAAAQNLKAIGIEP